MNEFDHSLKIGILGGGQLGRMLIQSAINYDLTIYCLDPDPNAPSKSLAHVFEVGELTDYETVYNFGLTCDVITIEIEQVNIQALKELKKLGKIVFPQPEALEIIQDKRKQKQFFERNNIPTAQFKLIDNKEKIREYNDFLPAVNKIGEGGYDGKGVRIIRTEADIEKAFESPSLLEKYIDFDKELAVMVARNEDGEIKNYSVVEMVFNKQANLVDYLISPAEIPDNVRDEAISIARRTIEAFGLVGLLAVELFLTKDGQLLVNEVAPRPHNSAHHTQKANLVSQFDQFFRAILNLPLGDSEEISKAGMFNLLGEEDHEGIALYFGLEKLLAMKNVFPFIYGKKITKPFRKMGHVTILGDSTAEIKGKIQEAKKLIIVKGR